MTLPTPRALLTTLLTTLPSSPTPSALLSTTKTHLLTFHVLFPNEFLPALDIIDRKLITRLVLSNVPTEQVTTTEELTAVNEPIDPDAAAPGTTSAVTAYLVRSTQPSGRFTDAFGAHYRVEPVAWNCTCPAFAFSAFPAGGFGTDEGGTDDGEVDEGENIGDGDSVKFGGLSRGQRVPICKHLLAVVLAERMGQGVEEKIVGVEEMAGWAAGWGG
ncbi:hypothetical protein BT63DRAFT_422180 [Microthyrium microscopicum]|uniref:SWIM-type domain-containing protein n=1 Tax=Microthyrium microscopicum TaxID=703497 RepID=A0A6A6UL66_9PEZI|nr:hypothetical protein BT63DRAFT_422180 [Microthyrium microscopicum]